MHLAMQTALALRPALRLHGEFLLPEDAKDLRSKAFRPRFATWAGYFSQRAKSNQKRLWVGLGDLPFGSPRIKSGAGSAMLGSSGGRSTHALRLHSRASCAVGANRPCVPACAPLRHTLPQIRLILRFSAASTAERSEKALCSGRMRLPCRSNEYWQQVSISVGLCSSSLEGAEHRRAGRIQGSVCLSEAS